MENQDRIWHGIGVMSGTSLDGLDLGYCLFYGDHRFEIKVFESIPYPDEMSLLLQSAYEATGEDLKNAETFYSDFVGDSLVQFINKHDLEPEFIALHGHTIYHQPERKMTYQMLNGHIILEKTEITTIFNFRSLDVALGGNGAPLVPLGDKYLFSEYDACLNIGGFANISAEVNQEYIAYDICPANIILNRLSSEKGKAFDKDGQMAREGNISNPLLNALNALDYYAKPAPKSLGREWVDQAFNSRMHGFGFQERISTITEHCAIQIARSFDQLGAKKVLCTGGGAFNKYLIERIRHHSAAELIIPEKKLIEGKEALIFAFLGKRRLENKINVLSSATGASRDSSSGIILAPSQLY
jgi:anhydro-N-acetylmuramic acid kinase